MREKNLIRLILSCGIFFASIGVANSQQETSLRANGLEFLMSTPYACEPDGILGILYQVTIIDPVGALFHFNNSARVYAHIVKRDSLSLRMPSHVQRVLGFESIISENSFEHFLRLDLANTSVLDGNGNVSHQLQLVDGDSVYVSGELATDIVGISYKKAIKETLLSKWEHSKGSRVGDENYDIEIDFNNSGVIEIGDFLMFDRVNYVISNWQALLSTELATKIYIRTKTSDMNRDGIIEFADFLTFAQLFGSRYGEDRYNVRADLDGNGKIDFTDFIEFAIGYNM